MTDFLERLGRDLADAADRLDAGRAPARRRRPLVAALGAAAVAAVVFAIAAGGGGERAERAVPAATPTATAKPDRFARFYTVSVESALAKVDRLLDIPVAVPAALPDGTLANPDVRAYTFEGERSVQLGVRTPDGDIISIQYGRAGFDGCGPLKSPEVVNIKGDRGLLYVRRANFGRGKPRPLYSTVLWPVSKGELEGAYGISGPLNGEEALALARSMETAADAPSRRPRNC